MHAGFSVVGSRISHVSARTPAVHSGRFSVSSGISPVRKDGSMSVLGAERTEEGLYRQ